jgi:hypothetical protein
MGGERTTTDTSQEREVTPEQKELDRLALERAQANQQGLIGLQGSGLDFMTQLFGGLGGQELGGPIGDVLRGIDPSVTQGLVDQAVGDVNLGAQAQGLADSGIRAELAARTSGDIRRSVAESNLNRIMGLANLATTGQAAVQQPILGSQSALGGRLAQFGTTRGQTIQRTPNPFLSSFQSSFGSALGQKLGNPSFEMGPFTFGG